MSELTININQSTHKTLLQLAEISGDTVQTVMDKAIENYRRYLFLVQANQAFTALRNDEELWQEELAERQLWEETLIDGAEEL